MEQIGGYTFGYVYRDKIKKEEVDKFANVFGEGSIALTELIKYCILNDISTLSCCKGHPDRGNALDRLFSRGYITFLFDMNDDNADFYYFLASLPLSKSGIIAHIEDEFNVGKIITLYVPTRTRKMSEKYFKYILDSIRNYKDDELDVYINLDVKKIIDYMFYNSNDDESFSISHSGYIKYETEGIHLKKVASCVSSNNWFIMSKKNSRTLKRARKLEEFINLSSRKLEK